MSTPVTGGIGFPPCGCRHHLFDHAIAADGFTDDGCSVCACTRYTAQVLQPWRP